MKKMKNLITLAVCVLAALTVATAAGPTDWPQFRGSAGAGIADTSKLPTEWSTTKNVAWVVDIPGRAWSSPIVWRERVYLTTAVSKGDFKEPSTGIYGNEYVAELQKQGLPMEEIINRVNKRDIEKTAEVDDVRYVVMALDARTGKVLWQQDAHQGKPFGGRHRKNTYASETPVTDGERLYVSFGQNIGLFAYTLDGELLWKQQWPPTRIYLDFGTASSPVVHGGRVFVQQDSEDGSYLTALDAKTGRQLWRTTREYEGFLKSSWSTPLVWAHAGRTEIVTTGHGMIRSYSVETGAELWRIAIAGITMPTPSPLVANGVLYVGTGAQNGEGSRPFFAIRPGASGDITPKAGQTGNAFVVWTQAKASGYTPSALVHDNRVYLVHDTGVMGVYAADTGRQLFKARVGGVGHTFSASPVAVGNRLYFLDEEGTTIVLEAGDSYKELAQNALDEMTLASPAVAEGSLFIRTETKLYRIG
jgi:outer membrane protein assembly factor BamB